MKKEEYMIIDGMEIPINGEKNILEVCRKANIEIPTFCYHSDLSVYGACRLCLVDVEGQGITASCSTPIQNGLKIKTNTAEIREIRKVNLELLLANHKIDCPSCVRSSNCKLQDLTRRLGVDEITYKKTNKVEPIDNFSPSIVRDPNKCVLCGECVRVCKEIQSVGAIDFTQRGANTKVQPAFGKNFSEVECVYCGQCLTVCPTGALYAKSEIEKVWDDVYNEEKVVIAQIAPAVRVALTEEFGGKAGDVSIGQIVSALKRMGFNHVYDTSFAADLTIFEEATEFIKRKTGNGVLPQFTSCCPGWVKFAEQYFPDLIPNLSSCKSPQQMFGSVAKDILPQILGVKKENIVLVSIMPCTAKKFEAKRDEFSKDGIADVDHVITTVELAKMIAETGIQFNKLAPQSLDLPLGFKTGGGVIFGNSGGVSEAVLRFAHEKLTGKTLENVDFSLVRGTKGLREAKVQLGDTSLKIAIVHSLANAREICNRVSKGECDYDFIEVMACPGGCIDGGGQPVSWEPDFKAKRTAGLYNADKMLQLHKPQDNPYIHELYKNNLGEVGGNKAHELLHTKYKARRRITETKISLGHHTNKKIEIKVCIGTNCFVKGSQDILKKLMKYISENNLENIVEFKAIDDHVDVSATFCMENCLNAPNIKVGGINIEKATYEKVIEILEKQLSLKLIELELN
jgi:NADH-quinone oxidoreductase subunit G